MLWTAGKKKDFWIQQLQLFYHIQSTFDKKIKRLISDENDLDPWNIKIPKIQI